MKTEGQITQKLKQTMFRHRKRELRRLLKRSAPNCSNNRTLDLEFGPVGVCSLDCQVCDSRFEDRAPECEDWDLKYEKEKLKESLNEFFETRALSEIAVRFPDVAALMWAGRDDEGATEEKLRTPPGEIPYLSFFGVDLWVDTRREADLVAREYASLDFSRTLLREASEALGVDPEKVPSALGNSLSKIQALEDDLESLQGKLAESEAELARASQILDDAERMKDLLGVSVPEVPVREPWWRKLWPF